MKPSPAPVVSTTSVAMAAIRATRLPSVARLPAAPRVMTAHFAPRARRAASTSGSEADIGQAYDLIASSYMLKNASFTEFVGQIDQFVKFWTGCQFKRPRRA